MASATLSAVGVDLCDHFTNRTPFGYTAVRGSDMVSLRREHGQQAQREQADSSHPRPPHCTGHKYGD
jgi:hypothetical protein